MVLEQGSSILICHRSHLSKIVCMLGLVGSLHVGGVLGSKGGYCPTLIKYREYKSSYCVTLIKLKGLSIYINL